MYTGGIRYTMVSVFKTDSVCLDTIIPNNNSLSSLQSGADSCTLETIIG